MKVIVLGAGVIGVTTAWYLSRDGHEVTVIERAPSPGLETSFANAGQISAGYAAPWAAPGIPLKALRWMLQRHAPLVLGTRPSLEMLRWLGRAFKNCSRPNHSINRTRMLRLASFSRDCLAELRSELGLEYHAGTGGTLQLFRDDHQLTTAHSDIRALEEAGVRYSLLGRNECMQVEPGLSRACTDIVGGLHLPDDETGDCFIFTSRLAECAAGAGVRFNYGCIAYSPALEGGRLSGIETSQGRFVADAYVVALGTASAPWMRNLSVRIPVYPIKGYSITADLLESEHGPRSTILDEKLKIAFTRLGSRIRVAGLAELAGYDRSLRQARMETLCHAIELLFPAVTVPDLGSFWSGLRPMTPDGTPIIGPTSFDNLFLNTGHGTLGWTMACGSAQIVADILSGRSSRIETRDLALSRCAPF